MFLTVEELRELTGRVHLKAQVKALRAMGIEHRQRPDGSIVVLRAHFEQVLGIGVSSQARRKSAPDLSMVN